MTLDAYHVMLYGAVLLNLGIVFGISVPTCLRHIRELRTTQAMREILFAYEQDLRDQGVTLPPRCVCCFQILPDHVEICDMRPHYERLGKVTEFITRPPIKYYPKGEHPPEVEN
jgi:hypothetical protein